jgi:uncharacterized metal-binding protein
MILFSQKVLHFGKYSAIMKKITLVTILGKLWLFYVFPLTSIDFSAFTYNENATSRKLFSVSLAIQLSP